MSRLPLGAGPLNCPTSRRKLSNCARRVWVRLSQHQLCPGRLCPWWLTGGELCCLLQAEGDGGSGEPSSEAMTRERRPVLRLPQIWGCLHKIAALDLEGSLSPERSFSWVSFLRRDFIIRAPVYCMLSACCIHLSGLFSFMWSLGCQMQPVPPVSFLFPAHVQALTSSLIPQPRPPPARRGLSK